MTVHVIHNFYELQALLENQGITFYNNQLLVLIDKHKIGESFYYAVTFANTANYLDRDSYYVCQFKQYKDHLELFELTDESRHFFEHFKYRAQSAKKEIVSKLFKKIYTKEG